MQRLALITLLLTLSSCALFSPNPNREHKDDEVLATLVPFTTDYCSEWPDGRKENPEQWAHCCFTHDLHYWIGGTNEERKESDRELRECVKISGSSLNAFLMYIGVRFGGQPGEASYSWGYGWTKSREYRPINKTRALAARELLKNSPRNQDPKEHKLIENFIQDVLDKKL